MAKYQQRLEARTLRRTGKSIKSIARSLGVSAGSVSIWCRDINLSYEQVERLREQVIRSGYKGRMMGAAMNKQKRQQAIEDYQKIGKKDVGRVSRRELFFLGLGLYAGEGFTYGNKAGIVNSNPRIIQIMLRWFRDFCAITDDRFVCEIGINASHKDRIHIVQKYWENTSGVPKAQFTKPSFKKVQSKKIYDNRETHFGTLSVRIRRGASVVYRIRGWIDAALS